MANLKKVLDELKDTCACHTPQHDTLQARCYHAATRCNAQSKHTLHCPHTRSHVHSTLSPSQPASYLHATPCVSPQHRPNLLAGRAPGLTSTLSATEMKLKKDVLGLKRKLMDIGQKKDEL